MIYSTKFLTLKRQKLTLGICEQPTAWFSDNHCVLPPRCCAVTVISALNVYVLKSNQIALTPLLVALTVCFCAALQFCLVVYSQYSTRRMCLLHESLSASIHAICYSTVSQPVFYVSNSFFLSDMELPHRQRRPLRCGPGPHCLHGVFLSQNTLCSEKKHPLTFSFISLWIIRGFKQNLQWIYPRIDRFWQWKN